MIKAAAILKELRKDSKSVSRESAERNIYRIRFGASAAILTNILVVIVYSSPGNVLPSDMLWGRYVVIAHSVMMASMSVILVASLVLLRHGQNIKAAYILQYFTVAILMASGSALAAIDQLVTTNITPYMIVCIITGTIFLIRPRYSFIVFFASYAAFFVLSGIEPHSNDALLSNRSDGFAVTVVGYLISFIMWHYHLTNMRQRRRIEQQQKQMEEIAYTDSLTGLLNRRHFDDIIKNEVVSAQSAPRESSLILFDLDLFKNINDEFGHPAGDSILIQLGELLTKNIRGTDTLSRLGGEEFIILLPGTRLEDAIAVAESLRTLIEQHPFIIAGKQAHITASFGVARLDYSLDPTLINQYSTVDKALYLAKSQGRNRIVSI